MFKDNYETVVDIGGFLGETAWWLISEGYARRVIVFEPVYYELCKLNVGDVAEVYPQAVHWERKVLRFNVSGIASQPSVNGKRPAESITLTEVLSSLTGDIAVKMDYKDSIPHTPCDMLRRAEEYH